MAKAKITEPKVEKPAAHNADVEKSVEKQPASTQDIKQKADNIHGMSGHNKFSKFKK
jgi:hypothetical protein